jgi:hypothetical protein
LIFTTDAIAVLPDFPDESMRSYIATMLEEDTSDLVVELARSARMHPF